jgi:hypothetical protein
MYDGLALMFEALLPTHTATALTLLRDLLPYEVTTCIRAFTTAHTHMPLGYQRAHNIYSAPMHSFAYMYSSGSKTRFLHRRLRRHLFHRAGAP